MTTTNPLSDLTTKLQVLRRTRDPIRREQLAQELLAAFRPALATVRRQAAQEAIAGGMRPADYARAIGVSRGAVDHLLHR